MNEKIYEQLIEGRDGILLDENWIAQVIEEIYFDEVEKKEKKEKKEEKRGHVELLHNQFYENCLKALDEQEIDENDLKKYEVLSTVIKAIDSAKDIDLKNLDITKEELETVKAEAERLISKLKEKYEKTLKEEYEELSKDYNETVQSIIIDAIFKKFFNQISTNTDEDDPMCIRDILSDIIAIKGDYKKLIDLCTTKDNAINVKEEIVEIKEKAINETNKKLTEQDKAILSLDDYSNIDDELTEIIREDLNFEELRKHCKNEDEMKIVDCIIELKERIVNNIKNTALRMRSKNELFKGWYIYINFKTEDFIQRLDEKIYGELIPEDILDELNLMDEYYDDVDCEFKSVLYNRSGVLLTILRNYLNDDTDSFGDFEMYDAEGFEYDDEDYDYFEPMRNKEDDYDDYDDYDEYDDYDDPIGYTGMPEVRGRRR